MIKGRIILAIGAHPDDEILGVGGTLRRHVLEGDSVHVTIVCEGETMRYQGREVGLADQARRVADLLGFTSLELLGLQDQHLDSMSLTKVIDPIEKMVRRLWPQVVYTHFAGDLNRDHRVVAEAVSVACRPLEASIEELLCFETPSSTEWNTPSQFLPNHFVDISGTLEDKLKAMAFYPTEIRDYPHPRSLESLRHRAAYWGSCVMMEAAEAFVVCRSVRRLDLKKV